MHLTTASLSIQSSRLELVAVSMELAYADLRNRSELTRLLNVRIPESWPPPLVDNEILEWTISKLEKSPCDLIWFSRYFVLKEPRTLIGFGGFKGPPNAVGIIEIGYSILPDYQERGYAKEAVKALCEWAFSDRQVRRIIAETYPDLTASISVLENCRFSYVGNGSEVGIVRYELCRPRR